jgi:hypothetical protein
LFRAFCRAAASRPTWRSTPRLAWPTANRAVSIYGEGSPWPDIRLLCGARIEILVEKIAPDDPAVRTLLDLASVRAPAFWVTDGSRRLCVEEPQARPSRAGLGRVGADAAVGEAGAEVQRVTDRAAGRDLRAVVGRLDPVGIGRLGHGDLGRGGVHAVAGREQAVAQAVDAGRSHQFFSLSTNGGRSSTKL